MLPGSNLIIIVLLNIMNNLLICCIVKLTKLFNSNCKTSKTGWVNVSFLLHHLPNVVPSYGVVEIVLDLFLHFALSVTTEPTYKVLKFLFIAQCLYTVTEDNKDALQQMAAQEALQFLDKLLKRQPASAHEMLMQSLLTGMYTIAVISHLWIIPNLINTFFSTFAITSSDLFLIWQAVDIYYAKQIICMSNSF